MKCSRKPVRKCHGCPLNQGDHCWLYKWPRGQWRDGRACWACHDPNAAAAFQEWLKRPDVMSRRDLRRMAHRQRRGGEAGEGRDWLAKRRRS